MVEFVWHYSVAHQRIPPTRRKRHHDIFYTSGVIACFVSNSVAMATRVGPVKIWLTSLACPWEHRLLEANVSEISLIQAELWPILSQISLPCQRGLVAIEFVWHHSIAQPRKPPVRRKDLRDISYTSRVIAFLSQISLPWQQGSSEGNFKWCR